MEIEAALDSGYLRPGNILVLDNAANHSGKENIVLEDWLWKRHRVVVLFLPARAPEWNPIELVWSCLEARLRTYKLRRIRQTKKDCAMYAAADILKKVTPEDCIPKAVSSTTTRTKLLN